MSGGQLLHLKPLLGNRYVATHNLHGTVATNGKTAKEVLRDQEGTSHRVSATFCAKILVETPKSQSVLVECAIRFSISLLQRSKAS